MDENKLLEKFDKLDLPNKYCAQIIKKFPQFVIYKKYNKYRALAHCTACDKEFTVTDGSGDYNDILAADTYPNIGEIKHKNIGKCPCCGAYVTFLSCGQLSKVYETKENFVIFSAQNKKLYMECLLVRQFFRGGDIDYVFERKARYVAFEGGWKKWIYKWFYGRGGWKQQWGECVTLGEPHFQNGFGYGCADNTYTVINEAAVNKMSFCRSKAMYDKARYEGGWYNMLVSYCCLSAAKPGIEALLNGGCGEIALSYIAGNKHGMRLNLNSNNPKKILGLNTEELKKFQCKTNDAMYMLSQYKRYKKHLDIPGSFEKRWEHFLKHKAHLDNIIDIQASTQLSATTIINYIEKQSALKYKGKITNMMIDWKDYLRQCATLEYDRTDTAINKPRDLPEAHNKLTELVKYRESEILQKKLDKLSGWRKKLRFSSGDLIIIEPQTVKEIIDEGEALHHCVGGYADDHAEGTTNIMFLRRAEAPQTPYYTIEIDTFGHIVQCHGAYNNVKSLGGVPKPQNVKDFEKEYSEHLKTVFAKQNKNRVRIGA